MSRLRPLWPALAWLGLIFLGSSLPLGGPHLFTGIDKVAHFAEYAILAALAVLGLGAARAGGLFLRVLAAVPIMALVAAADELHQAWIPGRCPDVLDGAADLAGILAGSAIVLAVMLARKRGPRAG